MANDIRIDRAGLARGVLPLALAICVSARAETFDVADRAVTGDVTVINIPWRFAGGTVATASAQREPFLAGWFIGRNDRRVEPATAVFVTAPKCRDAVFVTTFKPMKAIGK